jgi:hypothetical protein
LINNQKGVQKLLKRTVYQSPALVPPSPWIKGEKPSSPAIAITPEGIGYKIRIAPQPNVRFWILQTKQGKEWKLQILEGAIESARIGPTEVIAFSGLGLTGLQGKAVIYAIKE